TFFYVIDFKHKLINYFALIVFIIIFECCTLFIIFISMLAAIVWLRQLSFEGQGLYIYEFIWILKAIKTLSYRVHRCVLKAGCGTERAAITSHLAKTTEHGMRAGKCVKGWEPIYWS
ncbi:unnamed protein product, partial [Staurois parvus]